jgi:hypothetical protein
VARRGKITRRDNDGARAVHAASRTSLLMRRKLNALTEIVDYVDRGERVSTELDKTLISLSAGALIFTMTFVGTFAPGKRWLPLLCSLGKLRRVDDVCCTLDAKSSNGNNRRSR